jgi:hypothetical protein
MDIWRAWRDPDGTPSFYIRKAVNRQRCDVIDPRHEPSRSHEASPRFMADPGSHRPRATSGSIPPTSTSNKRSTSSLAVADQRNYLAWWMAPLSGSDPRAKDPHAMLRDIVAIHEDPTNGMREAA